MHIRIDVQLEPGEIDLATELLNTLRCARFVAVMLSNVKA